MILLSHLENHLLEADALLHSNLRVTVVSVSRFLNVVQLDSSPPHCHKVYQPLSVNLLFLGCISEKLGKPQHGHVRTTETVCLDIKCQLH